MPKRRTFPLTVHAFIVVLAAIAGIAASATGHRDYFGPPWVVVPLAVSLVAAGAIQVQFTWRDDQYTLDLFEAVLVPLLAAFAGPWAVAIAATAKFVSQRLLRVERVKALFNTALYGAATGIASVIYVAASGGRFQVWGLVVAAVAALMTTHLGVSIVIALAQRGTVGDVLRFLGPRLAPGSLAAGTANISIGLLFASVAVDRPSLSVLLVVPLVLFGWAQKAYAEVVTDRARIAALQQATHQLAEAEDPTAPLHAVLDAVRSAFSATSVGIVLGDAVELHSGDGQAALTGVRLVEVTTTTSTKRVTAGDGSAEGAVLAEHGHRSALVAPLRVNRRSYGTLVTVDRSGLQGFDDGELAVFEALAIELSGAFDRARLHAEVAREREHLAEVIDASSDGIFTVSASGTIEDWNPAMAAITGFTAEEAIGGRATAILRPRTEDDHEVQVEQWTAVPLRELPTQFVVLTRSGEPRTIACSFSQTSSHPPSLVVVARDITRQRELDRLRDDFVATVSHELRTPLTSIVGFTTMLMEPPRPLSEKERNDSLTMIRRGARRLERLVFNLLEVSRVEAGKPREPGPVDIQAACESAVAEVHEHFPNREIRVSGGSGAVQPVGNQVSVEQILANLIGNACKYAPHGPVEVILSETPDSMTIAVRDHGPGIAPSEVERVFDRFHRVDHHHVQAGTGLGLYISRQLAIAMHGKLTVESTPGKGATFSLTLPAEVHLVAVS